MSHDEVDQLRQDLAVAHGQRDRWKNGFLIEAARAEAGKVLMEDIVRCVRSVDGSVKDGDLMAKMLMDMGSAMAVYRMRYGKAPQLPGALELLSDDSRAALELAGLKLLLEPLRPYVEARLKDDQIEADEYQMERYPDDGEVTVRVPAGLLRTLAGVLKS